MTPTSQDRALSVKEAYDALEAFGRSAGRVPLLLLMHAAVPQSFRADLVNLLKQNFLATEAGTDMTVDADVLLSPLVQPAAGGYYRLDPEVRRHCLALLDAAYRDRPLRRSVEVAWFLMAYAEALEQQAGLTLDPLLVDYLDVQRWVAASFIDPGRSAATFARAIADRVTSSRTTASALLGSITAAISVPLSGQENLLAYARGLDAVERGDADAAQRLLEWTRDSELVVGGVSLRPGRELLARLGAEKSGGPSTSAQSQATAPAAAQPVSTTSERSTEADLVPRFFVPSLGPPMIGRVRELERARTLLTQPSPADASRNGPRVVRIVGEDGMGKWTLANALVNRTNVPASFPDGVVWLGEDGSGYPVRAINAFAGSAGVSDLIDDRGLLRPERFSQMLAGRRVLFVVEQRSASDIVGMVIGNAGPGCGVLHLVPADRTDNPNRVTLEPLESEEMSLFIGRTDQGSLSAAALSEYAEGNPLLLNLAITAHQAGIALQPRKEEIWATVDGLIESLWQRLPTPARATLREFNALRPEHLTVFRKRDLEDLPVSGDENVLALLHRFHLTDDLGEDVRVHPRVRAALLRASLQGGDDVTPANSPSSDTDYSSKYVYVSFANADSGPATKLMNGLRAAGLEVRNFDFHASQERGDLGSPSTTDHVRRTIRDAAVFVPVISEHLERTRTSTVGLELQIALDESDRRPGGLFIIPAAVSQSVSPESLPRGLTDRQWLRAQGGELSEDALAQIARAVARSSRNSSGDPPPSPDSTLNGNPPDPRLRTDDFAAVVGIRDYPGLGTKIDGADVAAQTIVEWLSSPQGGGIPRENLTLLTQPSHDSIQRALVALADSVQPSRRATPPRRLYLYFSGAVMSGGSGEVGLLSSDATSTRPRTVGVFEWRRFFHDGVFAEVVFVLVGVQLPMSPMATVTGAPPTPSQSRRAARLFSVELTSERPTGSADGTDPTAVLVTGLRGAAADQDGRVTSKSLAAFLDQSLRARPWGALPPRIELSGDIDFTSAPPPPTAT